MSLLKKSANCLLLFFVLAIGCSGGTEAGLDMAEFKPKNPTPAPTPNPTPKPKKYGKVIEIKSDADYNKYAQIPHVGYFWASWCGWCTKQSPVIEKLAQANPSIPFLKINSDTCKGTATARGVRALPTTFIKSVKITGFSDEQNMQAEIERQFGKSRAGTRKKK